MLFRTARLLSLLFAFLPGIAAAQQLTLPANSVYGRLGIPSNGGPAQAISFANLFAGAGVVAGPQSCSTHNWFNSIAAQRHPGLRSAILLGPVQHDRGLATDPPDGLDARRRAKQGLFQRRWFLSRRSIPMARSPALPHRERERSPSRRTPLALGSPPRAIAPTTRRAIRKSLQRRAHARQCHDTGELWHRTGTASTSAVFQGMGSSSCHLTPTYSGRIKFEFFAR